MSLDRRRVNGLEPGMVGYESAQHRRKLPKKGHRRVQSDPGTLQTFVKSIGSFGDIGELAWAP